MRLRAKAEEERLAKKQTLDDIVRQYKGAAFGERGPLRAILHDLLAETYPDIKSRATAIGNYLKQERCQQVYTMSNAAGTKTYTGRARNVKVRQAAHSKGKGAAAAGGFTTDLPLLTQRNGLTDDQWERMETLLCMEKYGVDNAHGWRYTRIPRSAEDRKKAIEEVQEELNLCRRCSRRGHFITQCNHTKHAKLCGGGVIVDNEDE
jgi:hypothetical protein